LLDYIYITITGIATIQITVKAPGDTLYVIFVSNKNNLNLPYPDIEPGLF
jgi:hypothetical protein